MRIGYYFHVPCVLEASGTGRIRSEHGIFLKTLAELVGEPLTVFAHSLPEPTGIEDMSLGPPLVRWVDIGPRASALGRSFRPGEALKHFRRELGSLDVMIVRGPTPLLPHLVRAAGRTPVVLLVRGDYGSWGAQSHFPWWRNAAVKALLELNVFRQRRAAKGRLAFVQNPTLAPTARGADITYLTFTTVSRSELDSIDASATPWPAGKGTTEPVKLMYAGRIVRDKGVLEAVGALRILQDRGCRATLDLYGWIQDGDPIGKEIERRARDLGVDGLVHFRGYVPRGPKLMQAYRDADVFVIPTYWDSLPKAMQEAMAAGLPVVAARVGGIGHYFRDKETAMLVEPRKAELVAGAVEELIRDPQLRERVARQGREWAAAHTLESDCEAIVAEIDTLLRRMREPT